MLRLSEQQVIIYLGLQHYTMEYLTSLDLFSTTEKKTNSVSQKPNYLIFLFLTDKHNHSSLTIPFQ